MYKSMIQWIRDNYASHGRQWLYDNFQQCCYDVELKPGRLALNQDTYDRTIRKICTEKPVTESSDIKTVSQAIGFHELDLTRFSIDKIYANSWGSETNQNKQLKLELKQKTNEINTKKLVEDFKLQVENYKPPTLIIEREEKQTPKLYEISIPDFHMGLLAWAREAGEDYNVESSSSLYIKCIKYFLSKAPVDTDRILLLAGSDFFNSDTLDNTTIKGTIQSEDGRFQRTFEIGWKTMVDAINLCKQVADVDVIVVSGNHDTQRSFFLGCVLQAWFKDDQQVNINNEPKYYKYYHWNTTLIGISHGNTAKMEILPMIMANDVPDLWAKSTNREFHIGHMHTSITRGFGSEVEMTGCKVVSVPSLAAASDWIAKMGYRSVRESQAFIYDKDFGRIGTLSYRPNMN